MRKPNPNITREHTTPSPPSPHHGNRKVGRFEPIRFEPIEEKEEEEIRYNSDPESRDSDEELAAIFDEKIQIDDRQSSQLRAYATDGRSSAISKTLMLEETGYPAKRPKYDIHTRRKNLPTTPETTTEEKPSQAEAMMSRLIDRRFPKRTFFKAKRGGAHQYHGPAAHMKSADMKHTGPIFSHTLKPNASKTAMKKPTATRPSLTAI